MKISHDAESMSLVSVNKLSGGIWQERSFDLENSDYLGIVGMYFISITCRYTNPIKDFFYLNNNVTMKKSRHMLWAYILDNWLPTQAFYIVYHEST